MRYFPAILTSFALFVHGPTPQPAYELPLRFGVAHSGGVGQIEFDVAALLNNFSFLTAMQQPSWLMECPGDARQLADFLNPSSNTVHRFRFQNRTVLAVLTRNVYVDEDWPSALLEHINATLPMPRVTQAEWQALLDQMDVLRTASIVDALRKFPNTQLFRELRDAMVERHQGLQNFWVDNWLQNPCWGSLQAFVHGSLNVFAHLINFSVIKSEDAIKFKFKFDDSPLFYNTVLEQTWRNTSSDVDHIKLRPDVLESEKRTPFFRWFVNGTNARFVNQLLVMHYRQGREFLPFEGDPFVLC